MNFDVKVSHSDLANASRLNRVSAASMARSCSRALKRCWSALIRALRAFSVARALHDHVSAPVLIQSWLARTQMRDCAAVVTSGR